MAKKYQKELRRYGKSVLFDPIFSPRDLTKLFEKLKQKLKTEIGISCKIGISSDGKIQFR